MISANCKPSASGASRPVAKTLTRSTYVFAQHIIAHGMPHIAHCPLVVTDSSGSDVTVHQWFWVIKRRHRYCCCIVCPHTLPDPANDFTRLACRPYRPISLKHPVISHTTSHAVCSLPVCVRKHAPVVYRRLWWLCSSTS